MDNNRFDNIEENAVEITDETSQEIAESEESNNPGNKFFRGVLTAAVSVSFVVFVSLLLYFCENTGA